MSRETGYVWLRRYQRNGVAGLLELNPAPQRHANQTGEEVERAVLELRQAHMRWEPWKLKRILERDRPGRAWPPTSTICEIVKRGAGGGTQEAPVHRAVRRASGARQRLELGVVRRFQGGGFAPAMEPGLIR